jgi:hypothetical protein
MNERIEQLARQAGALPTQDCGVPQWYIDEDEFEKFTELIIEEMYCFMVDATSNDEPWPSFDEILEHFGVE